VALRGYAQFFYITADDYSGSLVDALFGAVHNTFKNVGFGVDYNVMDLDVDNTDKDWTGCSIWASRSLRQRIPGRRSRGSSSISLK
jgi:hypothetical protein